MGKAVELAARFVRSWDDPSGARFAELEVSTGHRRRFARAWRLQDTVEVDLTSNQWTGAGAESRNFVDDFLAWLQSAPLCAGTRLMRLRLRVDWIGHVKHGRIRPATFRLVFVCKSPPSLSASKAAPNDLESLPVIDLGYTRFMGLFNEIMAPENLGLEFQLDINNLASSIWNREPLEGVEGYEGFAVLKAGTPIAIFFVVLDSGGGGWLGFAGLLPRFRRTRVVAAAARCAVEMLDRIGAFPLTIEIEFANRSSLQMAERHCGPAQNFVAVYDCPLHGT